MNEEVIRAFEAMYGPSEGRRRYFSVMAGVLSDFTKELDKNPGRPMRETYRLDDGRGEITVSGEKTASGPRIDIAFTSYPR